MRLSNFVLAFRKAITCLKRISEATVAFVQRPEAEVRIREAKLGLGSYIKPFCEFVGKIDWNFLSIFALYCWGRGSYWVFLAFLLVPSPCCGYCCRRFPVLSHFVSVNRFLFYRRTVVVRSG